jgi:ABC-2 type transport system ATP-binding protein
VENVITAKDVWKKYGSTNALCNFSIEVPRASVFLIMGPNGSGKSTFLKLITGLIKPTRGKLETLGLDPWKQRHNIFKQVGAMFEDHAFPDGVSGRACLEYLAQLKNMRNPEAEEEALRAARLFGVDEYWDRNVSTYSSGMKRKLALASAFLGDPELVILDDPTVAIDKQSRANLEKIVEAGSEKGKTFLITSHIITEFESLVTHVAIMNQGNLLMSGEIRELMQRTSLYQVGVKTDKPEVAAKILIQKGYTVTAKENLIIVEGAGDTEQILNALRKEGIDAEMDQTKPNLWNLYSKVLTA